MPRFRLLDSVRIYVVPFKIRVSHWKPHWSRYIYISNSWTEGWWTCGKKIEVASYLSWKKAWSAGKNLHTNARFPITMEIQSCNQFLGQPWIYPVHHARHSHHRHLRSHSISPPNSTDRNMFTIAAAQTTIYPYLSPKMDPNFPFNIPNGSLGC